MLLRYIYSELKDSKLPTLPVGSEGDSGADLEHLCWAQDAVKSQEGGVVCLKPIDWKMKKHFGFNSKKPVLFRDSSTSPCGEGGNGVNQQSGYHIRDKDLGKIHRAACEGDVARVQQILLLRRNGPNDKDKRNR